MIFNKKIKTAFLLLVVLQGVHSAEEYMGRLWAIFPPARFLTGLVSNNHESGFLIINIGLFVFGLWCWLFPVLKEYSYTRGLIFFWIIIELINGIGHPLWSLYQKAYTPGTITAPILLIVAVYLLLKLMHYNTINLKSEK